MPFVVVWVVIVVAGMAGFLGGKQIAENLPEENKCSWCQPNQPMYGAADR